MASLKEQKNRFLEYVEIEKGRALRTIENYDQWLSRFLAFAKTDNPGAITDELVREFRIWLNRQSAGRKDKSLTLSKKTQNYHLIALRAFLKYLARQDIKTLPAERIELAKVSQRELDLITPLELGRLFDSASGNDLPDLRDRAILELLFSTGLRLGELCSLSSDINLSSDELSVRGKGGKIRVVFLSEGAKKAVKKYLAARKDMSDALFAQISKKMDARPLTKRSIERIVKQHAIKAGISKRVTPHTIRHCLHPDTLVFLPHTIMSAKELFQSSIKNITAIDFKKGKTIKSQIVQKSAHISTSIVNLSANGYITSVSQDHKFFTIGKYGIEEVFAKDLNKDRFVAGVRKVRMDSSNKSGQKNKWRLVGYITGDGTISEKRRGVIIADKNIFFINYYKDIIISEYKHEPTVFKQPNTNSNLLNFYSKSFVKYLRKIGITEKSPLRRVPKTLFSQNKDNIRNFLAGYYDAEGNEGSSIRFFSTSKMLLKDVQMLLLTLGIDSHLYTRLR